MDNNNNIGMKNAFNTIRRDHFLKACFLRAPTLYQLAHHAYAAPSDLLFGSDIIQSQTGIQQGDPLEPSLFTLGVDEVARNVSTPLNIWYLDDANLGGSFDCVRKNLNFIIPALSRIGLSINFDKSEIINIGCTPDEFELAIRCINGALPGARVIHPANLQILGSLILEAGIKNTFSKKRSILSQMSSRLLLIDSHPALFLLRNSFSIPKLLYILRPAPCYESPDEVGKIDGILRKCAVDICNVYFNDTGWRIATLLIRFGGLGLRSVSDISEVAYLASMHATEGLVKKILSNFSESLFDNFLAVCVQSWNKYNFVLPETKSSQLQ